MSSRASQRPGPGFQAGPPHQPPEADRTDQDDEDARGDADTRTTFERILPELIRRGLEAGRGPFEKVSESIFPKDIASQLASQLASQFVDVRSGVVKAVAQEVGRFLREADIASEVRKVLTGMTIEAKVQLRFNQREDGSLSPKVDVTLEEPTERKKSR
jgi:hypothetical protein